MEGKEGDGCAGRWARSRRLTLAGGEVAASGPVPARPTGPPVEAVPGAAVVVGDGATSAVSSKSRSRSGTKPRATRRSWTSTLRRPAHSDASTKRTYEVAHEGTQREVSAIEDVGAVLLDALYEEWVRP